MNEKRVSGKTQKIYKQKQEDFSMAVIKNFDEIVERVNGFPEPMSVIVAAAQDEQTCTGRRNHKTGSGWR